MTYAECATPASAEKFEVVSEGIWPMHYDGSRPEGHMTKQTGIVDDDVPCSAKSDPRGHWWSLGRTAACWHPAGGGSTHKIQVPHSSASPIDVIANHFKMSIVM